MNAQPKSLKVDLDRLAQITTPVIEGAGYELVDLEWKRELGAWILRLYIDKPNGPHEKGQGITLDGCADVSRELSTLLDVEEEAIGLGTAAYELEVSSPGIDRQLRRPQDFGKAIGKKVKVRTEHAIGPAPGRRNFAGRLERMNAENTLFIDVGDRVCEVPVSEVEKANVIFEPAASEAPTSKQKPTNKARDGAGENRRE